MKHSKSKPFTPIVTIEQIVNYDKDNPETYTASPFMNAVCDAFQEIGLVRGTVIARYMHLDARSFSGAVKVMTGLGYGELRVVLEKILFKKMKKENPKMFDKDILKTLGLMHRSTSWRIKNDINQATYKPKRRRYEPYGISEETLLRNKKTSEELEEKYKKTFTTHEN